MEPKEFTFVDGTIVFPGFGEKVTKITSITTDSVGKGFSTFQAEFCVFQDQHVITIWYKDKETLEQNRAQFFEWVKICKENLSNEGREAGILESLEALRKYAEEKKEAGRDMVNHVLQIAIGKVQGLLQKKRR